MMRSSLPLIVTWSDLRFVWEKYKRWLLRIALVSAVAAVLAALFLPVRNTAKALFREGGASSGISASGIPGLFSSLVSGNPDGSSLVVMQSDRVIQRAVKNLGLQITLEESGSLLKRVFANILLLFGKEVKEDRSFVFHNVEYAGREPLNFSLIFKDEKRFVLQDRKGKVLSEAFLGERIALPEASFALLQTPSHFAIGKPYRFSISPWEAVAGGIRSKLEIRPEKLDKSLLRLFFSHPKREEAERILNGVMAAYMEYLQDENNRLAEQQLAFLDQRQEQFAAKFDKELADYLTCLKQNISEYGFFEVNQEAELFALRQEEMKTKLLDLDNQLSRLKKVQSSYASAAQSETPSESQQTFAIVPAQNLSVRSAASGPKLQNNRIEQFAGIDLQTAESLYREYQKEVDQCQEQIDTISFALSRIHQKEFDLNALGALVHDPVTANLINRASELALQGKDVANRSQKDLQRIEESLTAQKDFIAQHLGQSLELYKQNSLIAQRKLARLRDVMMALVEAEKSGLYTRLQEIRESSSELPARWKLEKQLHLKGEVIRKMIEGVTQIMEGKTIEHRLKQLNSKVIDSAHCPLQPRKLPLAFLLALFIGGSVSAAYFFFFCRLLLRGFPLSESNARALGLATSGTLGPLSDALIHDLPQSDMATIRSLANFVQEKKKQGGGVVVALTSVKRPSFVHNLARVLHMRDERVLIVDASFDFAQPRAEEGTLWDYLTEKSEVWQPQKADGFDTLASGATGRFCTELLYKERFAQLLTKAKCEYHVVLLVCSGTAAHELSRMFEKMDALIVTLQEETIEQLERTGVIDQLKETASSVIVFQRS